LLTAWQCTCCSEARVGSTSGEQQIVAAKWTLQPYGLCAKPIHLTLCCACAGKIGWVAKAIVYALIGGLCCRSAVDERSNVDTSPQVC
jgi:hypothetical protein